MEIDITIRYGAKKEGTNCVATCTVIHLLYNLLTPCSSWFAALEIQLLPVQE